MYENKINIKLNVKEKVLYRFEETIKILRTNIQFSGKNIKKILFTSSVSGEGKSSISFRLALSLASIGKKVVYIDADLRKSVLTTRYRIEGSAYGLSQFLSGQTGNEEIIYKTNIENLDIVFAGPYSPNPTELLEEGEFERFIKENEKDYDYMIFDTPPLISVIDAAIVAKSCDAAIIVVQSSATSYKLVQKVKQQLEKTGCKILGLVLNKSDRKQSSYYGKYDEYEKY